MKILFVDPHESSLFSFRKEIVERLISYGHDVILCTEETKKTVSYFGKKVSKIINVKMDLKNTNLFSNYLLKREYKRIIKDEKPDLIISYKIKPNIYCASYAKNIPMIANITGLGNMFIKKGFLYKLGVHLYRKAFKNVDYIFFQNNDGLDFFIKNKIAVKNYSIIPGSGVNINSFSIDNSKISELTSINFLFASRGIKEKGFYLLLDSIPNVIRAIPNVHFNFVSAEEDILKDRRFLEVFNENKSNISVLSRTDDMNKLYSMNHFLVSPSFYREGISNILLESLMCGRPIITTKDNPGCKEVLQDGINGFGVISRSQFSLEEALIKAAKTPINEILQMGKNGRKFVCDKFDREFVINAYISTINEISKKRASNEE